MTSTMNIDRILCHCLKVTESRIREAVEFHGARNVQDVTQQTGAGSGCLACRRLIGRLLESQTTSATPP